MKHRCLWAQNQSETYQKYHDEEWGTPVHDDQILFEFLILEGAQAGLSWSTILNKRQGYRDAFAHFDPKKVAAFTPEREKKLREDPNIVRNKLKINAAISNAKAFLDVQKAHSSFDSYIWSFVDHHPIQNHYNNHADIPAETELSKTISKDLKKRGFRFVGPTIVYAFMQAIGMVNDHTLDCYRYPEIQNLS